MRPSAELALSPLWQIRPETLTFNERVQLSYERCKSVVQAYKLTGEDILEVTEKYWKFHTDPILLLDGSVGTLLTIHYNLCAGTLAMFAKRQDVAMTLDKVLNFEYSGQFCLTEIGHGLDVINMETTATLLPSGEYVLTTPVKRAAKYMPPTSPCGTPVIAVVFARLIVNGEDRGPKPFMVMLSDGYRMCKGIVCQVLSPRGGSRPVKHALTYFQNVRLPANALLGSMEKPKDARLEFFYNISRVISGTLSMGALGVSAMQIASYVGGKYSLRRTVIDAATATPRPIISFSTQYSPVLTAISQTMVMEAYANWSREAFVASRKNIPLKHFIAAIFKATILRFAQSTSLVLGDRCGAQGLSEINQLSVMHADMRGAAIAEGDILGISIRFAMEVILGRMTAPPMSDPDHVLAKHETSILEELRGRLAAAPSHRDPQFEREVLPHCQGFIESIGHRLAYETAVKAGLDYRVIDLFVASVIKLDAAWYAEKGGLSRSAQFDMESTAAAALFPDTEKLLDALDIKEFVTAPIVSDKAWDSYLDTVETFGKFDDDVFSDYVPVVQVASRL